jgi:DNA-binding PucR family transcriptional regulator
MRLQATAARLHLHPNAVKYRLARIKDILGLDPYDSEHHLTYHIATKLVRLLTSALCP